MKDWVLYILLRFLVLPLGFCPFFLLRFFGKILGYIGYFTLSSYRKRALSNLAMAEKLHLTPQECKKIARKSFQNLMINCLEYPKLYHMKDLSKAVVCINPEVAQSLHDQGIGILFFCGHQSNWEVLFLDGTRRMKGLTIGKPTKNPYLYQWILQIRERYRGKVVNPKHAIKEMLTALKKGVFVGIVGDQGTPESDYSYPFFGRRAYISTITALLSYKTKSPIIIATTKRTRKGYEITYSDPIFPDPKTPREQETIRLMDQTLSCFEKSIKNSLEEWLWTHNRWKKQTPEILHKRFRHDVVGVLLPQNVEKLFTLTPALQALRRIYPKEYFIVWAPYKTSLPNLSYDEIHYYKEEKDLFQEDLRIKIVFNFSGYSSLKKYFLKQSAFSVLEEKDFFHLAKEHLTNKATLEEACLKTLCRPNSLWNTKEKTHAS